MQPNARHAVTERKQTSQQVISGGGFVLMCVKSWFKSAQTLVFPMSSKMCVSGHHRQGGSDSDTHPLTSDTSWRHSWQPGINRKLHILQLRVFFFLKNIIFKGLASDINTIVTSFWGEINQ